jgi:hypothetical protein
MGLTTPTTTVPTTEPTLTTPTTKTLTSSSLLRTATHWYDGNEFRLVGTSLLSILVPDGTDDEHDHVFQNNNNNNQLVVVLSIDDAIERVNMVWNVRCVNGSLPRAIESTVGLVEVLYRDPDYYTSIRRQR